MVYDTGSVRRLQSRCWQGLQLVVLFTEMGKTIEEQVLKGVRTGRKSFQAMDRNRITYEKSESFSCTMRRFEVQTHDNIAVGKV